MNRRNFLQCLAGGGMFVATSGLSALAEDNPGVFPRRGGWERLVLNYVQIPAGATTPFSLLHISDTHLTSVYGNESTNRQRIARTRTVTFGGRQEEALRDSIAWAAKHTDFLLHTGDLMDFQSQANVDIVNESLFKTGVDGRPDWPGITMFAVGNHEYSYEMWLEEQKCTLDDAWRQTHPPLINLPEQAQTLAFSSRVINGVNFICMDDVYGTVSAEQVSLFRTEVARGLPIILCMHVPFYTDAIWRAQAVYWKNAKKFSAETTFEARGDLKRQQEDPVTRDFIAYLKSEPLLKGILAGHLHIGVSDRFSPTAMEYVVGGNFMFHGQQVLIT